LIKKQNESFDFVMKVIILAAGIGKRLGPASDDRPKCLLNFAGKSLLRLHLQHLMHKQVTEIAIVYGYRRELIDAELRNINIRVPVTTIFNPEFNLGSVVSFWYSREILRSGSDIILMDADVLYDPAILDALFTTRHENCFLLDHDFEPGDEPVKLCVHNGMLVEFRKEVDANLRYETQGESVGFFRFSRSMSRKLADRAQDYIDKGRKDEPYEEVIRDLLLSEPQSFAYEDITGMPWVEIDFPEDIARAGQVLNSLRYLPLVN
jgi:choline kinase